jgi:hypothetical protein
MLHRVATHGLCLVAALALGCTRSEPEPTPKPSAAAPELATRVVIAAAGGAEALTIELVRDKVDVRAGARHIVGQTKGDKRYYHQGSISGEAFVEVKISDTGFKVRTPDSKLLWKVKVADDKIKVSDNEENLNAWTLKTLKTLKTKYDDKVKVEDSSEHEIGEVRFNAESGKIKVKDASDTELFVLESGKRSAAYGVLLMSAVPEQYRDVIIAELLARGQ